MAKEKSLSQQRREKSQKGEAIVEHPITENTPKNAFDQRIDADVALLNHYMTLDKYFEKELHYINDDELREAITSYVARQPKFKMEKPTSSTGKYHPSWQNGEGGNGRHTKNVVKILCVFNRAYPNLKWDEVYAAAILHDMSKYTVYSDEHTHSEHPVIEAKNVLEYSKNFNRKLRKQFKFIAHLIKWHDGRFNCEFADREKINKNYTKGLNRKMKYAESHLLHLADMISAGKSLWEEIF